MEECEGADFLTATSVIRRGKTADVFDSHLLPEWKSGGGLNGGVLLVIAARAAASAMNVATDDFFPSTVSASFLTTSQPGPATVYAEIIRGGSRISTGQVSITQTARGGQCTERVRALVTHGKLNSRPVAATAAPPRLPAPEACVSLRDTPAEFVQRLDLLDGLDVRLSPGCVGWIFDSPARAGRFDGWVRLADGQQPDPMVLLVAAHALPPISFDFGHVGWLPTVQLTAHIRDRPAPGWLQVRTSTRVACDQSVVEDAEVWDARGSLVVQSRQFAALV
ncbi:thioesterase family protein [Streptomyces sp. NPDC057702]|uniref:thioesterase family protein n=1 Tax=unclassified Streptomyces TaxID=2593676 RepID=UPI0036977D7D